jgi:hypothetical protein
MTWVGIVGSRGGWRRGPFDGSLTYKGTACTVSGRSSRSFAAASTPAPVQRPHDTPRARYGRASRHRSGVGTAAGRVPPTGPDGRPILADGGQRVGAVPPAAPGGERAPLPLRRAGPDRHACRDCSSRTSRSRARRRATGSRAAVARRRARACAGNLRQLLLRLRLAAPVVLEAPVHLDPPCGSTCTPCSRTPSADEVGGACCRRWTRVQPGARGVARRGADALRPHRAARAWRSAGPRPTRRGKLDVAIVAARRSLAFEPISEDAHRT